MWDCEHCGCQAIAGTVTFCPQCFTPRYPENVAAESSTPDASASTDANVEVRETPQPHPDDGDWGTTNG